MGYRSHGNRRRDLPPPDFRYLTLSKTISGHALGPVPRQHDTYKAVGGSIVVGIKNSYIKIWRSLFDTKT
jgi:hypothetical protein